MEDDELQSINMQSWIMWQGKYLLIIYSTGLYCNLQLLAFILQFSLENKTMEKFGLIT